MNERIKKLLKERHCLTSHDRYGDSHPDDYYHMYPEDIDELIELIRNDEREECAKVCEEHGDKWAEGNDEWCNGQATASYYCAIAIRARGEQEQPR